jgi:hypothetical protein
MSRTHDRCAGPTTDEQDPREMSRTHDRRAGELTSGVEQSKGKHRETKELQKKHIHLRLQFPNAFSSQPFPTSPKLFPTLPTILPTFSKKFPKISPRNCHKLYQCFYQHFPTNSDFPHKLPTVSNQR